MLELLWRLVRLIIAGAVTRKNLLDFLESPDGYRSYVGPNRYTVVVQEQKSTQEIFNSLRWDRCQYIRNACATFLTDTVERNAQARSVDIHLVFMHKRASMQDVLTRLDELDLKAATLKEALALFVKFPRLTFDFSITALGTVADKWGENPIDKSVPYFYEPDNDAERGTVIWMVEHRLTRPFHEHVCFLGVSKQDYRITHHT